MFIKIVFSALVLIFYVQSTTAYSAAEDARAIAEYKKLRTGLNHAKNARQLVHQSNWSPVGTLSKESSILGYPMVNPISIDDSTPSGTSTGKIHFLLTDLDFTGQDWQETNKVTFTFSDEQNLNCKNKNIDPMEPTCMRAMISGKVKKILKEDASYSDALAAFINRHPAAENWIPVHKFYLCELDIENIFVLDFYGGPHTVTKEEYYNVVL